MNESDEISGAEKIAISEADVTWVAKLSCLELAPADLARFTKELNSIIGYVKSLDKFDVSHVAEMCHASGATNVFRDDVAFSSLTAEAAMEGAPDHIGDYFRVPIVVDDS